MMHLAAVPAVKRNIDHTMWRNPEPHVIDKTIQPYEQMRYSPHQLQASNLYMLKQNFMGPEEILALLVFRVGFIGSDMF